MQLRCRLIATPVPALDCLGFIPGTSCLLVQTLGGSVEDSVDWVPASHKGDLD